MLLKKTPFVFAFITLTFMGFSQHNLPMNEGFQNAVENNTRTTEGKPGSCYWQNRASYDITADIIPSQKKLEGTETITYTNNSRDTLRKVVLKLFQNLYKKGAAKDFAIHPADIQKGTDIKEFKIRQKTSDDYRISGTNMIAGLPKPLLPGQTLSIGIKWSFPIPSYSNIRMGAKNDSAFFLGQWYPKMAVYDDLKGWDMQQHTGHPEFYSDAGDYTYTINVPEGYLVWGTGLLSNPKDVLAKKIFNRFQEAHTSDQIINIVRQKDYESDKPVTKRNSWHFKARNVPDVAFGVSNHHLWDATSLNGIQDKNIFVEAAYPTSAKDFTEVAALAKKAVRYNSENLPGYPYPFPAVTVFNGTNGSSGMEYPMIANNPSADNRGRTVDVTAHEITHNYFPFFVLTNETEHAWMDEMFASMLTYYHQMETEPTLNRMTRYAKRVSQHAPTDKNIATMTNSTMLQERPYYFNFYTKPAMGLFFLQDMLGMEMFRESLVAFIETWKGKHPAPYDFFYSVNQTTGINLNWYWKRWFFESPRPDLAIEKTEQNSESINITIRKIGNLPVPVRLSIFYKDQTSEKIERSPAVWENSEKLILTVDSGKEIQTIRLGNEYIPDTNKENNVYQKN